MELGEYRAVRLNSENLKDFLIIYNEVHQNSFDLNYFQKKFDTNYTGLNFVGYLAYHIESNEPAAFYGVFPVLIGHKGQSLLAAQSGDTITSPKHQRKGLFIFLAHLTIELAKKAGVKFIFGFPNENSSPGFYNKLKWEMDHHLLRYYYKTNAFPFSKIFTKLGQVKLYEAFIAARSKRYSKNLKLTDNTDENSYLIARNAKYIKYKSFSVSYFITIEGINFWFKTHNGLHIGDYYAPQDTNYEMLKSAINKLSRITGQNQVVFYISEHSPSVELWNKIAEPIKDISCCFTSLDGNQYKPLVFTFADRDTF
jgi:hypothetical protein